MQVKKQQLEPGMEKRLVPIGKVVSQGCILSPCLFNSYAEYTMQNAKLDESQVVVKIAGKNINSLRNAEETTLMAEIEEKSKSFFLMDMKEESGRVGLKLNIKKTKIMASSHITYGKQMGKQQKQWQTLFSWAPKSL